MGRGYPVEQWLEWIEQQKSSGLSITEFCRSIGVSQNAFYLRRKKLDRQAGAQAGTHRPPTFVSLKVTDRDSCGVRIELSCGAVVSSSDQETIRTVVTTLLDYGATS